MLERIRKRKCAYCKRRATSMIGRRYLCKSCFIEERERLKKERRVRDRKLYKGRKS